MKYSSFFFFSLFLFSQCSNTPQIPQTVAFDGNLLNYSFQQIKNGNADFTDAYQQLLIDAEECLTEGPYTVISKSKTPPSGNKHDYMSMGPYWWSNPETPDGLPYIRRDGERNPERLLITDREYLRKLTNAVETLGLAYYFSKEEKYAEHAALLLRVWFLDEATLMNPHLNYGQGVPGITDGRPYGLIETSAFVGMLDGVRLLESSNLWTNDDNNALKAWFTKFFEWKHTSAIGIAERSTLNNHGTWYDAQSIAIALYIGKDDIAKQIASEQSAARLRSQIMPDGSQPHELARADAWSYSTMNLRGFFTIATMAEKVDVDIWNVANDEGKPYMQTALEFLIPTFEDSSRWEYSQLSDRFDRGTMLNLLQRAAIAYNEPHYAELFQKYQPTERRATRNRNILLWSR